MRATGVMFCLGSAAAFGAMGVLGKLAYADGATVGTLLSVRFDMAAALLWTVVAITGRLQKVRDLPRRDLGGALALGAICYGAGAACAFAALERLDASLFSLLLYTFPVLVALSAIALRREPPSRRLTATLVLSSGGLVLVLGGAASGALDPLGTTLALLGAIIYAAYVLASAGVSARVDALLLGALLSTGAAISLTLGALAGGDFDPARVSAAGYLWLAALAVISTVAAITLFCAGMRRVGPTAAAILSTFEPVVSVGLAFIVLGVTLRPIQLLGGALVLAAVLAIRVSQPAHNPHLLPVPTNDR